MTDDFPSLRSRHNGERYLSPTDLAVLPRSPQRVLIVGSCLAEVWRSRSEYPCDFVLTNNLNRLPESPPRDIQDYDFQLVQIPLRFTMPDAAIWKLSFQDGAAHRKAFDDAVQRLRQFMTTLLAWNANFKILTFCANFLVPQQNPMGRFAPRYDLRNPVYFVEQLNLHLAEGLKGYSNAYLLDIDHIASVFGKKNVQDDSVQILGHGALLSDAGNDRDANRIEPIEPLTRHYSLIPADFVAAVWHEAVAMYKSLHQEDAVKLVIVDLDNTLWRGVIADGDVIDDLTTEGWPLGLIEALVYLKKRGVVLAIASQNDEETIRGLWPQLMRGRFTLDDFAIAKINWNPKVDNIGEILRTVNILPRHTVFIDDNPVERARVQTEFPDMRVLGKHPYYLKRILLWSPELQAPTITEESARRTELIQAQAARECARQSMSREAFLSSLEIVVEGFNVSSIEHPSFPRVFELINKTNQFNTTARRWTKAECDSYFECGNEFYVFKVRDSFSDYGLVGCVMISLGQIDQFVMSCRVIGLDVEVTVMANILDQMRNAGLKEASGQLFETKDNFPCRELFRNSGFKQDGGLWIRSISATAMVEH